MRSREWWTWYVTVMAIMAIVLSLGCTMRLGGHYVPEGPHPHVTYAMEGVAGPFALGHAAVSNSRPVDDLTTFLIGPTFGPLDVRLGVVAHRLWVGPCNEEGHQCQKEWETGLAGSVGLSSEGAGVQYRFYGDGPVGGALFFYIHRGLF